ncbi:sensor histidine kinase [Brevibacterium luteolum]|uniref:sensor histidine kinase n=1 Tax=Brevibacterium luteolum TaxID=199591 RepID=UPI001C2308E6|nr:histidine kinase [Brevibacterium luteolum]MBU8580056.1 two-component sensor histidine kinase [Brevibacterium luteolum]
MESLTRPAVRERYDAVLLDRPWVIDLVLAVLLGLVGAAGRPTLSFATPEQSAYTLIVVLCSVSMIFRRVRPLFVLNVVGLLLVMHMVLVHELSVFAGITCLVAAYTSQTQLNPPWRRIYTTMVYAGTILAVLTAPPIAFLGNWMVNAATAAMAVVLVTAAVLAGVVRRNRKDRYMDAIEHAAALEARRDVERRLATVQERTRIAREMHDVLGHSLNTIAVQAEGVRYVVRTEPDRADQVLADIGRLSRSAVDDVRSLINVLNADNGTEVPMRPAPTLSDVADLIGDLKYTKANIRLRIEGDPAKVPDPVGLAAYRIVQESLTNILKHADGAGATVHISVDRSAVGLTILNTPAAASSTSANYEVRRGITGMRERARALGGTLSAGPNPDTGGWFVTATLPWRQS